ncbi:porin [Chitinimonas taiwanensis]|uniref:Outer membrane protein (Porin) n=1 Tax=Chitinimonas taiwanensis DSM 18899 TaxID=1121279 RepID=A0A1K2HRB1_9NEIS|nr:porin [Chitinimonas taiwanensis]SFZ79332.1 Outer membrane protein (porin) [Chitinimonas taiwanensis DSM 18899]
MQKQLIALAVLGALSAPAFAADNSVTLYGRLELGVEAFDNGDTSLMKVEGYSSRIGFKGEEDLGDGLKAIWQIETKVSPDSGSNGTKPEDNSLTTRNSFVGLKGDFGTILLGRHDTPFKQLNKNIDVMWGNAEQTEVITNGKASGINLHTRQNNVLHYTSPKFANVTMRASYAPDEDKGTYTGNAAGSEKNRFSVSGEYDDGTFNVGIGYENQADEVAKGKDRTGLKLVGGAKFGDTTLGLGYSKLENEGAKEVDTYALAVTHKIDKITLKGSFASADESKGGAQDGVDMYGVEVDYALSKRTAVYGLYTAIKNDVKAKGEFVNGTTKGAPSAAGKDPAILSVGVRHSF